MEELELVVEWEQVAVGMAAAELHLEADSELN